MVSYIEKILPPELPLKIFVDTSKNPIRCLVEIYWDGTTADVENETKIIKREGKEIKDVFDKKRIFGSS